MNPDQLASLESERGFLLRSLRDLEAEHGAGDVDADDYVTLRDGYTARAAAVLRQLDDGRAALRRRAPRNWRRMIVVAVTLVVFVAGAGWLVARSSGQRLPGDVGSGGVADTSVSGLLARARSAFSAGDIAGALDGYEAVLDASPGDPEALSYSSLILFMTSSNLPDEVSERAIEVAKQRLDEAVDSDPSYADPHCFRALIASGVDDDADTADTERDRCLALDPPADVLAITNSFLTTGSPSGFSGEAVPLR